MTPPPTAVPRPASLPTAGRPARGGGFTLIELLVVIAIVVVLLGLLFPALSSVRNSARTASTKTLMNTVGNAMTAFRTDARRAPGYFTPQQVGSEENYNPTAQDRPGITMMGSVLLDLAGGVVDVGDSTDFPDADVFDSNTLCGDTASSRAWIAPALVGAKDGPGYLDLPGDVLRVVKGKRINGDVHEIESQEDQIAQVNAEWLMPEVIDPWNMPLLLWTSDRSANNAADDWTFAEEYSDCGGNNASVYWATNGSILASDGLGFGTKRINVRSASLLGSNNVSGNQNAGALRTLQALVGHPDFPNTDPSVAGPCGPVPFRALAENVLHSAGRDRIYAERTGQNIESLSYQGSNCQFEAPADSVNDIVAGVGG